MNELFSPTGLASQVLCCVSDRAGQNKSGAHLEFLMRTAMHGKSRVSSAISVCDN